VSAAVEIPNRHWKKPRAKNPRPIACIGAPGETGRTLGGAKQGREAWGVEWMPVQPRKGIMTPETALAAATINATAVELLGVLAVTLGVRRQYPNGLHHKSEADHAFWSAAQFFFGDGCVYCFETAYYCVAAAAGWENPNPDSVRYRLRAAALRLGRDSAPLGSAKPRRRAKVADLGGRAQEASAGAREVLA